ncbi:hypothetical protein MWMV17_MWMV17_00702 [Acinetobacter calcoaceticus]|uniref:Uncharacterized protein n=1 Tax=Acinetobacter calcoaceticus DSM 30006 = CIP 81.8 TaxID=981331 RepID=A0ABP2UF65_ACICA|nr:hypothetical protein [Acinetobacter calcoaceticus]ENV99026.1 hypothetical protein F936_02109 [Acinetobacter calcoaceticus DSM 30006 = CIP 81.8]CAI3111817.1 hypothetical protein MWMV17_MWMV17_00702 [Acinetobacter calcoaceticus]SUU55580.1 Uncharacterised protein [Acinetobacter calcoaceticus]
MFRLIIILASGISMLLATLWALSEPGFDSSGTLVTTVIAFLMSFKIPKDKETIAHKSQNISNRSIGIQADSIGNITINKDGNDNVDK